MDKKSKPKPLSVVDLISENQQLVEDNYKGKRDQATKLLALLIISWIGIVFLVWLAFFHFPKKEFVWTSDAGAVCAAIPVSEPNVNQQLVAQFALEAAVSAYTYDYVNYRRSVTEMADKYFTADFRNSYFSAFADSTALKSVLDNYYIVSAVSPPNKPPQIKDIGRKGATGAYFWDVQVPLKVSYSSGRRTSDENILATIRVIRVAPTKTNPTGIAVDSMQTAQMVNY